MRALTHCTNLIPHPADTQASGKFWHGRGTWMGSLYKCSDPPAQQYQYPHVMVLDRPLTPTDPRKTWIYDTMPDSVWGVWDVTWEYEREDGNGFPLTLLNDRRAYMFKSDADLMMFRLRWEHQDLA